MSLRLSTRKAHPNVFTQSSDGGGLQYEREDTVASFVKKLDEASTSDLVIAELGRYTVKGCDDSQRYGGTM